MSSRERRDRLLLLVSVVLLAAGVFTLDAGVQGDIPPLAGYENAYIVIATLQFAGGILLLWNVRRSKTFQRGGDGPV